MADFSLFISALAGGWLLYYAVKAFYLDVWMDDGGNNGEGRETDRVGELSGDGVEEVQVPILGSAPDETR